MSQPIRFGPFEVHISAGELRRNGRPVRIQEQPFQILAALLDHPGDVVTREQLRERLWPGDSFGDFDQGLNTAINKLREALSDSPAEPKYIETLPKRGYRFIASIAQSSLSPPVPSPAPPPTSANRNRLYVVLAGCLACATLGLIAGRTLSPPSSLSLPSRRWVVSPQEPLLSSPFAGGISISPDGQHIVGITSSARSLWVQRLDQLHGRRIDGTEGANSPFWSPDSRTIAFSAKGALMKIPVDGGAPIRLASLPGDGITFGGVWSPDSQSIIVAVGNPSRLFRVPATGGNPDPLLSNEAATRATRLVSDTAPGYFWAPQFLPGTSRLVYVLGYLNPTVVMQDLKTGEAQILDRSSGHAFATPGYLLSSRNANHEIWAQPISVQAVKTGEPFRVSENCIMPTVSRDQTLVCIEVPPEQLAWFDRLGNRKQLLGHPAQAIYFPALAPDDRRIAMETLEQANLDLWVLDSSSGSRLRLTSHTATDILPVWSPSGDQIAFSSYRSGSIDVWLRSADAASEESLLYGTPDHERVSDWSKDGNYILFTAAKDAQRDIHYLTRDNAGKWVPRPFLATPSSEQSAKLSPDGRYAAYLSDESGRNELYVREFPKGERKWAVSSHGAAGPLWSRDGKEIFYSENGTLVAVPVTTNPVFSSATPIRLFSHPVFARMEREPHYDVSLDRQRILLSDAVGGNNTRIHVLQNWLATLPHRTTER